MPFGYIGQNQTKQQVKNSGVLSSFDISLLEKKGEASGSLEHIQTITASSSATLSFTNLANYNYDTHYMTLDNFQCTTSTTRYMLCKLSNDNGSSYVGSGNHYDRAWTRVDTSGNMSDINGTSQNDISNFFSIDSDNRTSHGYVYFYNLLNPNTSSHVSFQSMNSVGDYIYFGGFNYTQVETVNAFQLFLGGDAFLTGTAKLYGVKL